MTQVEEDLIRIGYLRRHGDGSFAVDLPSAVMALQADAGLPVTGVLDADTLRVLRARIVHADAVGTGLIHD